MFDYPVPPFPPPSLMFRREFGCGCTCFIKEYDDSLHHERFSIDVQLDFDDQCLKHRTLPRVANSGDQTRLMIQLGKSVQMEGEVQPVAFRLEPLWQFFDSEALARFMTTEIEGGGTRKSFVRLSTCETAK